MKKQITKISIPERVIERKKIGKNSLLHLANKDERFEVEVLSYKPGVFLLRDKFKRNFYLKLPKIKTKLKNKNTLRAKNLLDINNLDENIKLNWDFHILQNGKRDPDKIVSSWKNHFYFREEINNQFGLRPPQIEAIHAIASHWSLSNKCWTIVMPTGTGKTEVMISILFYKQCRRVLVLVPSVVLRKQMLNKFSTLGCLREIGVIDQKTPNPRVSIIESGVKNLAEISELIDNSNVIIALSQTLKNFSKEAQEELAKRCSHLFIDEAHHVPARTWINIKELFKDKPVVQFTATPFRRDGKKVDGDIIYNYPLGKAQEDGYFKKINLIQIQEFDDRKADEVIAKSAIAALSSDLKRKNDHILMARCSNKKRAKQVLKIYKQLASQYNPEVITSDMNKTKIKDVFEKIKSRDTKIIVCVNMLGEGFDLPNLKIAAMHDAHKSLAVTLQFIGRFTRTSKNVGDATVVVNTGDPQVKEEVEDLYADDIVDWNKLLKEKSESTIQKEIDFHEFIDSFDGELSKYISLWNLRPAFSTLVYEVKRKSWSPEKFIDVIPTQYKYWHAKSDKEKILVVVISKEDEVSWGKYKDIKNHSYELCVAHWSDNHNALFIQCSDYDAINCDKLARAICGDSVKIKNGQKVFNVFSGVERTLGRNLGVRTVGKISYTMHFGVDITRGLSTLEKSHGVLNNFYGWGYDNGDRIDRGCSAGKGKIWSRGGGPILLWKQWCHRIADKIFDDSIEENKIIQEFLKPKELNSRHNSIPLSIQWSENILGSDEDATTVIFGTREYRAYEVNLEIIDFTSRGPITFRVSSDKEESKYKIEFKKGGCRYSLVKGSEVKIRRYSGDIIPLTDYVQRDPITVFYIDGSFSFNNFYVPTPKPNTFFDKNRLKSIDWTGTNIQVESLGKDGRKNSIQHKISEIMKDEYEIIFNDDAPGEAADLIALKQESNDSFRLHLVHCKFSSDKNPGSRIGDFYELCGQAQKSIRWKHNGIEYLYRHIKKREGTWQVGNKTRFVKGDMGDLNKLKKFSKYASKFNFEITIVQPGLKKNSVSDDIIQLLGNTEDYLLKTSDATFNVYCS